jgi:hypothetical protein
MIKADIWVVIAGLVTRFLTSCDDGDDDGLRSRRRRRLARRNVDRARLVPRSAISNQSWRI